MYLDIISAYRKKSLGKICMKKKFFEDLERIYLIIKNNQNEISSYYDILKEHPDEKKRDFIKQFLRKVGLKDTKENTMAVITRLVSLRDDAYTQALKKQNFSKEEIIRKKEEAYLWVANFHTNIHKSLIQKIENDKLLTPFYREVFNGTHEVGVTFSSWQSSWTAHIIDGVNRELYKLFQGDEEKIFQMLHEKELFDKGHDGQKGDRSYSVLVKQKDESFKSIPYKKAFSDEVNLSIKALNNFKDNLSKLEDNIFNQKQEYLNYLQSIITALNETINDNLIPRWADVDRAWMKITTPIQIGHPLEYYEDHYKKAVALEWDMRIVNPKSNAGEVKEHIKSMYNTLFYKLSDKKEIYQNTLSNVERVQLYLGRPALYYGAEFCGLFSAQVVPNDEIVTKEEGKKIFAFADNVLEGSRAKPFMKIQSTVFSKEFLDMGREVLFQKSDIWYEIYNITTIGHEYGHILWLDNDTESIMNKSGNFKNIEEFKATAGGLMAFFHNENENLKKHVMHDTIKRAVGLISWKQTGEVEPYYCEGLIHLSGLFECGVLSFKKNLEIDMSDEAYERMKKWYNKTYSSLAIHYLAKKDATEFLSLYATKEDKYFMPIDPNVKYFVNYYWNLHQDIGQILDENSSKDDWI